MVTAFEVTLLFLLNCPEPETSSFLHEKRNNVKTVAIVKQMELFVFILTSY